MIRRVSIPEFGPDGLTSTMGEAPGSMCVITVPGLNPEPSTGQKPRKLYVLAGNYHDAISFCLRKRLAARIITGPNSIVGLSDATFILTGYYRRRKDWERISELIRYCPGSAVIIDDPEPRMIATTLPGDVVHHSDGSLVVKEIGPFFIQGQTFKSKPWELGGVFDSESKAVAACKGHPDRWVAPIMLNTEAPGDSTDLPGVYYPAAKESGPDRGPSFPNLAEAMASYFRSRIKPFFGTAGFGPSEEPAPVHPLFP